MKPCPVICMHGNVCHLQIHSQGVPYLWHYSTSSLLLVVAIIAPVVPNHITPRPVVISTSTANGISIPQQSVGDNYTDGSPVISTTTTATPSVTNAPTARQGH